MSAAIDRKIAEGMAVLPPRLRAWSQSHLIKPRPIRCSLDPDGKEFKDFWLVTDHVGDNDSGYRVAYDPAEQRFGLVTEVPGGVQWYLGCYGSFAETIENM